MAWTGWINGPSNINLSGKKSTVLRRDRDYHQWNLSLRILDDVDLDFIHVLTKIV